MTNDSLRLTSICQRQVMDSSPTVFCLSGALTVADPFGSCHYPNDLRVNCPRPLSHLQASAMTHCWAGQLLSLTAHLSIMASFSRVNGSAGHHSLITLISGRVLTNLCLVGCRLVSARSIIHRLYIVLYHRLSVSLSEATLLDSHLRPILMKFFEKQESFSTKQKS